MKTEDSVQFSYKKEKIARQLKYLKSLTSNKDSLSCAAASRQNGKDFGKPKASRTAAVRKRCWL